jgi:mRNA interferase RelE/StbE
VIYRLEISEKARAQVRELPKEQRRLIGQRIEALQHDLQGDIKKLTATKNRYRLRVGDYRVLFVLENDSIAVYGVRNRKEAYE